MSFDRDQENDDQNENPSPANPARDPNQPTIVRPNPPQDQDDAWRAAPDYGSNGDDRGQQLQD